MRRRDVVHQHRLGGHGSSYEHERRDGAELANCWRRPALSTPRAHFVPERMVSSMYTFSRRTDMYLRSAHRNRAETGPNWTSPRHAIYRNSLKSATSIGALGRQYSGRTRTDSKETPWPHSSAF